MSLLPEVELGENFLPFVQFREKFGFVPNIFRAQTLLPRAIEAEAHIAATVVLRDAGLSRVQKERLLLVIALANQNTYCVATHAEVLGSLGVPDQQLKDLASDYRQAGLASADIALLEFSLKLRRYPTWIGSEDIGILRSHGFDDELILEAILVTGLAQFLCFLSAGLKVSPDVEPRLGTEPLPWVDTVRSAQTRHSRGGPYLQAVPMDPRTFPPFALFQERFGFIPNIFRAQTLRPDVLEAEAQAVRDILLTNDVLTRLQKESILLVISALNLNTYCVAVHCEMLRNLGIPDEQSDLIAMDHRQAGLSPADSALLDCSLKLAQRPNDFGREDIELLRESGFSDIQILECIVMTSLTQFLNTLQMGLGTVPDFEPLQVFPSEAWSSTEDPEKKVNLFSEPVRLKDQGVVYETEALHDEDANLVAQAKKGDLDAFEQLVRLHQGRVYRTLIFMTQNSSEAEDGMQDVFLRVFESIGGFQGTARFSTWLTRIAINEGVERLRKRREMESLDEESADEDEPFRPRYVVSWEDNPEQLYSKAEIRQLVQGELMKIPIKYRVPVLLRDLEQLSTEEAAQALDLAVPALKSRLLRGRLMLREALAPNFKKRAAGV